MVEKIAFCPGWSGKYNLEKICVYSISFNRNDLKPSTLNYYIKKGEYVSDFPIGVFKDEEKYYLVTTNSKINKQIITIHSYIGKIQGKSNIPQISNDALEALIHSLLDIFLVQNDYETPKRVRTFLGKSAKGKLSYRKEIYNSITINKENKPLTINIFKSVNFQVFISGKNEFKITCLPNFEIFDPITDLPMSKSKRNLLDNNQDFKSIVYLNPKSFLSRFEEFDKLLYEKLPEISYQFLQNIESNAPYTYKILNRNELFNITPMNLDFLLEANKEFEIQLRELFLSNKSKLPTIKIILLKDNYEFKNSSKQLIINQYIEELHNSSLFEIQEIVEFSNQSDINTTLDYPVILVMDDKAPGCEFLYEYVKEKFCVSKRINYSTIRNLVNKKLVSENILLMWLSLYFRQKGRLIWHKRTKYIFDNIHYINLLYDENTKGIRFSCTSLSLQDFTIKYLTQIYLEDTEEKLETRESVKAILNCLKEEYDLLGENNLYLVTEGRYSVDLILSLSKNYNCVFLKKPNCRLFIKEEEIVLPKNGTYLQFFNDSNSYIIISTGIPDQSLKGLPNPIHLEIFNRETIPQKEILQIIFDLTFYNPFSFSKTNLPFPITLYENRLFRKIPIYYNKEEPF